MTIILGGFLLAMVVSIIWNAFEAWLKPPQEYIVPHIDPRTGKPCWKIESRKTQD